jgi:hypothetical protein
VLLISGQLNQSLENSQKVTNQKKPNLIPRLRKNRNQRTTPSPKMTTKL